MKTFPTSKSPLSATSDLFRVRCLWHALSTGFALITWPVTGALAQDIDEEWRCHDVQMESAINATAKDILFHLDPFYEPPGGLARRDTAMGTSTLPALAWGWEKDSRYAITGGVFRSASEARQWWESQGLDQQWNLNNDAVGLINFSETSSWGNEITEGTLKARGVEGLGIDGDLWGISDRFVFHIGPLFYQSYSDLDEAIRLQRGFVHSAWGFYFKDCQSSANLQVETGGSQYFTYWDIDLYTLGGVLGAPISLSAIDRNDKPLSIGGDVVDYMSISAWRIHFTEPAQGVRLRVTYRGEDYDSRPFDVLDYVRPAFVEIPTEIGFDETVRLTVQIVNRKGEPVNRTHTVGVVERTRDLDSPFHSDGFSAPGGKLLCQDGRATVDYTAPAQKAIRTGQRSVFLVAYIDDPARPGFVGSRGPSTELRIPFSGVPQEVDWESVMTAGGDGTDTGIAVTAAPGDSAYVAGTSNSRVNLGDLFYVPPAGVAYGFLGKGTTGPAATDSPFASLDWLKAVISTERADVTAITADRDGNIYGTGTFLKNLGFDDVSLEGKDGELVSYMAKISPQGTIEWVKEVTKDDNYSLSTPKTVKSRFGVEVDIETEKFRVYQLPEKPNAGSSPMAIIGDASPLSDAERQARDLAGDPSDLMVVKFDGAGNQAWARRANAASDGHGYAVTFDRFDNIYAVGSFGGQAIPGVVTLDSAGDSDGLIIKYDGDGNVLWELRAGGTGMDSARAICITGEHNVLVAGQFEGTISVGEVVLTSRGASDIWVAQYSPAGEFQWATQAGGSQNDTVEDLIWHPRGMAYLCGSFSGQDATFGTDQLGSAGGTDAYAAVIDRTGRWLSALRAGGPQDDEAASLAAGEGAITYLCGTFTDSATFGDRTVQSAGGADLFVAELSPPLGDPPVIVNQPDTLTVTSGADARFEVEATGTGPFVYQWFRDGTAINGATSAVLHLTAVSEADVGDYHVRIANAAGAVDSNPATLTVASQPVIGFIGHYSSIAIDSQGQLHLATRAGSVLNYALRSSAGWAVSDVLDLGEGRRPFMINLALDSHDRPHISYSDFVDGDDAKLAYAHFDGTNWSNTIVESDSNSYGEYGTSIAVDSADRPHIAYHHHRFGYDGRHAWFDGAEWHIENFDTAEGYYASIVLDADNAPHIAYFKRGAGLSGAGSLAYTTREATGDWNRKTFEIESVALVRGATRILLDPQSGNPRIAYYERDAGKVSYAAYDGANWSVELVASGIPAASESLGIAGFALTRTGIPSVVFYDNGELKFAVRNGANQWAVEVLSSNSLGFFSYALGQNDEPHVVHLAKEPSYLEWIAGGPGSWHSEVVGGPAAPAETGFRITSIQIIDGEVEISFPTQQNRSYQIQRSLDLKSWSEDLPEVSGTGGIMTIEAGNVTAVRERYYRVLERTR